jgi:transglutaminase-like putative cysteine protease
VYRSFRALPAGAAVRIWVPVPPSNREQHVEIVSRKLPVQGKIHHEPVFGNRILYLEVEAGEDGAVPLSLVYRVTRREQRGDREGDEEPAALDKFLKPNRLVPIDGRPLTLIEDRRFPQDQLATARMLYDVVERHMRYGKEGTGWGRGDAVWACENGYGNCTDFHSLFMSLARSRNIPVRFEIGFLLPEKRGRGEIAGYHCWAGFRPAGRGWIPVDISEAAKNPRMRDYYFGNLTEDRVTFSIGRDLVLVPRQQGEPLNFFVYPYVEVDGRPYPEDRTRRRFEWQDVEAALERQDMADFEFMEGDAIIFRYGWEVLWDDPEMYNAGQPGICMDVARWVSDEINAALGHYARQAHQSLDLRHYSRSDFIVSPRGIYILEVNTLPGLTENSLFPRALNVAGGELGEFIDHLIEAARKDASALS